MTEQSPKRESGPARSFAFSSSLKERFERFMTSGNFAESIDAIKITHIPGRQRADYLARSRSVIIEQKSLDRDVDPKVRAFLDDLIREHGSLDSEEVTLAGIIDAVAKLARGNPFKPRLRAILTQRIDDLLAKADKQTRDTRLTFSIPEAVGVIIVLNERVQLIEPDYFVDKAWDMLRRELKPGTLRYPQNQVALLISEAHRIVADDGNENIPVETIFSDAGLKNPAAASFVEEFWRCWAEFNQAGAREWPGPIRDITTHHAAMLFKTR